jgi:hypothetical protein
MLAAFVSTRVVWGGEIGRVPERGEEKEMV